MPEFLSGLDNCGISIEVLGSLERFFLKRPVTLLPGGNGLSIATRAHLFPFDFCRRRVLKQDLQDSREKFEKSSEGSSEDPLWRFLDIDY